MIANIMPEYLQDIMAACSAKQFEEARRLHEQILPLILILEDEGVAAMKYALHLRCGMDPAVRLPLVPLSRAAERRVEDALQALPEIPIHLSIRHVAEDVQ